MTDHIDTAQEREKLAGLTGFTPGPWFAGKDYEDGPFVAGGGYDLINTVGPELDREPNARLIAAAPDLLATNHRLLDALDAERARAEKAEAEVDQLRAVLNDIYENVEYWNTLRISSKIRAALKRPEASHD